MVSKKLRGVLVGATAGVLAVMSYGALAQAPGGGPGGGMRMQLTRESVEQRNGLDNPELKLTADQKMQIDKLADGYVENMQKMMGGGGPPDMQAFMKARQDFAAAVGKVLNDEQRKMWEASQQRRGPGGGMGGNRGPGGGGPGGPPPGGN
jgi:Spy/CpxP family protein refolding chaperone